MNGLISLSVACVLLLMDVYMMVFSCATFSSIHMSGKYVHDTCLSQLLSYSPTPTPTHTLLFCSRTCSKFLIFPLHAFFLYCSYIFFLFSLSFTLLPFQNSTQSSEMSSSRWLSIYSGNFLCLVTFASLSSFSNVASRPRYHNNLCLPAHPCA